MSARKLTIYGPTNKNYMTVQQKRRAEANRQQALARLRSRNLINMVPNQNYNNQVRRATPQEVNYVDLNAATYAMDTTGTVTLIATIAQGAGVHQRIGKRAYYKSILIRGNMSNNSAATFNDTTWMIVYDKRPTGALPLITDILTGISTTAFMNDNNTGRFEVIRRKDQVLIGNTTTPSTGHEVLNIDEYIKMNKRPITFESVGNGQIGDIDMGALYFLTLGNSAASGTLAAKANVSFRVRFTER